VTITIGLDETCFLTPEEALTLADMLRRCAKNVDGRELPVAQVEIGDKDD
jgi:hypothetical protein